MSFSRIVKMPHPEADLDTRNLPIGEAPSYIPALDGLRGIAVLLVLCVHLVTGWHHNPILRTFFVATSFGWSGVDLFFVLSGFLITRILLSAKGNEGYFRNFYMRRVLRIFPLYYGVLVATLLLAPLIMAGPKPGLSQLWFWFYGQNLRPTLEKTDLAMPNPLNVAYDHFWSLAVEEHFYLIWPAIVWLTNIPTLKKICGIVVISAVTLRIGSVLAGFHANITYGVTLFRMDALAIGGFIATVAVSKQGVVALRKLSRIFIAIGAGVLLCVWLADGDLIWNKKFFLTIGFTLDALFYGGVLVYCASAPAGSVLQRVLTIHPLTFIGKYSYGIYVFHGLLLPWFDRWVTVQMIRERTHSYFVAVFVRLLLTTGISITVAFLSWHLYEKHWLKLKRLFKYRRKSAEEGVQ
jgi:peptidoglycan/LPS O-acetylase OafA/YrhL